MFLSNASVRRPIAMGCLIIALVLLGLNSYRKLGLELMPKMEAPFITVVTVYPGASPLDIETDITKRIEDAVSAIDGLKYITSSCMENISMIILEFDLDVSPDIASIDVREKIDLIRADLPADVEDPRILKFDVNAMPIITMALTGDHPIDELYDYADNTLKDRLTTLKGVGEVELIGGAKREVHVLLDRQRLAAKGLTAFNVYERVNQGVVNIPSGRLQDQSSEFSVKFDAEFQRVADIGSLEIANEGGGRVRIDDVGRVEMATEEIRQSATVDGRPCIMIRIIKKSDANAAAVAGNVRRRVTELNKTLPGGMDIVWVTDDGRYIESNVRSALKDIILGIILTTAILFVFLYNLRSLLVVAVTMPLTIVIGFFFMKLTGFTLNNSTLIAIGMSVGILVTNSIVVMEAIVKRLEITGNPDRAARGGAQETFVAVMASAGTNIVVLFPLARMESKVGMFLGPLALTMLIMTAVSLFISFTLTPILCAKLLKPREKQHHLFLDRLERIWNKGLDRVILTYQQILTFSESHRWASGLFIAIILLVLLQAMSLAGSIGFSLADSGDRGEVYIKIEYPTRYNLLETTRRVNTLGKRLKDLPEVRHQLTTIGKVEGGHGQSSEGVYLAQILLKFSDKNERDLSIEDLMNAIRSRLQGYPEAIVTVNRPSFTGGQEASVQLEISGESLDKLDQLALKTLKLAQSIPGLIDSDTSVRPGKPELKIYPNRSVLGDLNLPAVALGMTLRANLEGLEAGTFKQKARNYDIVVKLDDQSGRDQVRQFQFPGVSGKPVLLDTVGQVAQTRTPIQILRKNKQRISKVFAEIAPSLPLGTAVNRISELIDEKGQFPPGYGYNFAGRYEIMAEAQVGFKEALIIAVVLVFLTLAAILESFKQPFLIFATLPIALIGVLWALYIAGASIDIFVIMGCIMMVGIVVNNAILIMDKYNYLKSQGDSQASAMISACVERFRPIVMITLAAVLGMMPLAFGSGVGSEMRNSIGIAAVGGILVAGILTLLLVPMLHQLFTRKDSRDN